MASIDRGGHIEPPAQRRPRRIGTTFAADLEAQYRRDWSYYAGAGSTTYSGETVEALALPQAVLEKFYWKNAERIIGVR